MNDHDPNEDVLSIDPASVTGLDPGFGTASITDDGQRLTVRVAPGAHGSATLRYAVPDGTTEGGLLLAADDRHPDGRADPGVDSAPQWCGVQGCLVPWPSPRSPAAARSRCPCCRAGSIPRATRCCSFRSRTPSGVGSVAATPGGEVVYQHSDNGAGGEQLIELIVTVADTTGQTVDQAARRARHAEARARGAVLRGRRHARRGPHGRCRAARHRDDGHDVARVRPRARRCRRHGDDRRRDDDVRLHRGRTRHVPRRLHRHGRASRCHRDGADHAPARGCAAPSCRRRRSSSSSTRRRTRPLDVLAASRTRRGGCCCSATWWPTPTPARRSRSMPWGRTSCASRGTTASGAPGRLGTVAYTVSDGTDGPAAPA